MQKKTAKKNRFSSLLIKLCKFYSLPLLSSLLMGTSYIPFPPWAVFFCYVPLWLFALKQDRLKPLLAGAWLCQFFATLIGFNWVLYTIKEFGFFSWPLSAVGLLIFAGFANLHIPIALFFWFISQKKLMGKKGCGFLKRRGFTEPQQKNIEVSNNIKHSPLRNFCVLILLPLYSALIMKYYPMIFDWNWGYTWFYAKWPASQTAEIWGFQFLNTLTLFFNLVFLYVYLGLRPYIQKAQHSVCKKITGLFCYIFSSSSPYTSSTKVVLNEHNTKGQAGRLVKVFAVWFLFFAGLNFYGQYLKNRLPLPDKKTHILIVQPNIENFSKAHKLLGQDPRPAALLKLIQVTEKHFKTAPLSQPDFILWPEGAYPYSIKHDRKSATGGFAAKQARKWNTPLILSAVGKSPKGATNSIFTFNSKGKLVQPPYDKTLLLAFGEYLPGEKWLPVQKLFSYYGRSFVRGTGEHKIMPLNLDKFNKPVKQRLVEQEKPTASKSKKNKIKLGFQICYEGLFDFFTRELSLEGAQIIVNVTNDSWYGSRQEAYQHLYMTLSRAIEVRRPLVRGTNTGFSATISATGEINFLSPLNKSLSRLQKVPYHSKTQYTTFTKWGYYINFCFLWGLFVVVVCLFLLKLRRIVQ